MSRLLGIGRRKGAGAGKCISRGSEWKDVSQVYIVPVPGPNIARGKAVNGCSESRNLIHNRIFSSIPPSFPLFFYSSYHLFSLPNL